MNTESGKVFVVSASKESIVIAYECAVATQKLLGDERAKIVNYLIRTRYENLFGEYDFQMSLEPAELGQPPAFVQQFTDSSGADQGGSKHFLTDYDDAFFEQRPPIALTSHAHILTANGEDGWGLFKEGISNVTREPPEEEEPKNRSELIEERRRLTNTHFNYSKKTLSSNYAKALYLTDAEHASVDSELSSSWDKVRNYQKTTSKLIEDESGSYYRIPGSDGLVDPKALKQRIAKITGPAKADLIFKKVRNGRLFNYFGQYETEVWLETLDNGKVLFHERFPDQNDNVPEKVNSVLLKIGSIHVGGNWESIKQQWGHILSLP